MSAADDFEVYLAKKKELLAKFTILFPGGKEPACRLDCGLGWFPILDRLFTDLEAIVKDSGLTLEEAAFTIEQVKEKFGELRVYTSSIHTNIYDKVYNRIDEASRESAKVCENCGEPGSIDQNNVWLKTSCEKCKNKKE